MFTMTARGMPATYLTVFADKFYPHQVPMTLKKFTITACEMPVA